MGRPKLPRDEKGNIIRQKTEGVSLKTFVKEEIKKGVTDFDIKLDEKGNVNPTGLSSVKFSVESEPYNISISFHQGQTLHGTGATALEALQSIPAPDKIVGKAIFKISQGDKKKEMLFMPVKMKRIFYEKAQPVLIKWLSAGLK